tara:strand:+ start:410 stop:781 length:372 start_codon:yes stop_codon:yes gene_type:complete
MEQSSDEHFWQVRANKLSTQILNDKFEQMRYMYEKGRTRRLVLHIQYQKRINHWREVIKGLREEIHALTGNRPTVDRDGLDDGKFKQIPIVGFDDDLDLVSDDSTTSVSGLASCQHKMCEFLN